MKWAARVLNTDEMEHWEHLLRHHALGQCYMPMIDEQAAWEPCRIGLCTGSRIVGGLALGVRRIPGLPFSLARSSCILIGPEDHAAMLHVLLDEVDRLCSERSIIEVELRFRIPANGALPEFAYCQDIAATLTQRGYRPARRADRSYLVRIDRDNDALMASFADVCRNRIRKAIKRGCTVSVSTDPSLLEHFYQAHVNTCRRKGAPQVARKSLVEGLAPLLRKGHVLLFTECYGGRAANMVIVEALGIPCYRLGTRTEASLRGEVTSAAQVLHYEAMKHFRDQGKTFYDLGGCEGPDPVEQHPNYGVWRFKHNFRGVYVEFLPYLRKARGPVTRGLLGLARRVRGDEV